jgi:predicted NAD/FAD-dependent oxidoreductase
MRAAQGARQSVAIIGAGIAGLSCATALSKAGYHVELFDKARGPGGRMSTRRFETPMGEASADHGAQYFTARDPDFLEEVIGWALACVATPWTDVAEDCWVGVPGMNAIIRHLASAQSVRWNSRIETISATSAGWELATGEGPIGPFDAVVLAIPSDQALPFLAGNDFAMARRAMLARFQPCWTALFAFEAPLDTTLSFVRDVGAIGWACRESAKPQRHGPETWVVQANASWSSDHLEDDADAILTLLRQELGEALGTHVPQPIAQSSHRWRYAMSSGLGDGALWNSALSLGACGDWLLGPRVESGWLSGRAMAGAMLGKKVARAA